MGLDRRERSGELVEGIMVAQEGHQARIWTAMPGIIQSFDPVKRTCVIQPAIRGLVSKSDGTQEWVPLPLLLDCPVQFAGGGDVVLTFPLKLGDECLVVFASRCIDAWWQNGGIQNQVELRMHDLSDGFCIPGVSSVPRVETAISTTKATLRSRDGTVSVSVDPVNQVVDIVVPTSEARIAPAAIHLVAGAAVLDMNNTNIAFGMGGSAGITITSTGVTITGAVTIAGRDFVSHHHSGVATGGGNTGNVV